MGIEELTIKGFRSLRDVTWKPGKLNVVIGPNGSGKSNLLQALELLQSAGAGTLPEEILRRGGIAPLLYDEQARVIDWRFRAQTNEDPYIYQIALQRLGDSSSYRVQSESLDSGKIALIQRDTNRLDFLDRNEIRIEASKEIVPEDQSAVAKVTFPGLVHSKVLNFQRHLTSWRIYQDLRVDRSAPLRQAVVSRFEKRIAPDGQNAIAVLHTLYSSDRDFKENVDAAMRAAFGLDYEELAFPPAADQLVQLRLRWRSLKTPQSAANLSDGTLRFLLLIAILANPDPGDLIAIDEPETGLHPRMLPLVAELAADAAEKAQVIFTTHSPQFLDAFREEPPTTTVAQWVDGETQLSVLDGEELRRWLKDYSLGSLFLSGELEGLT
jgi:predicted ATPase